MDMAMAIHCCLIIQDFLKRTDSVGCAKRSDDLVSIINGHCIAKHLLLHRIVIVHFGDSTFSLPCLFDHFLKICFQIFHPKISFDVLIGSHTNPLSVPCEIPHPNKAVMIIGFIETFGKSLRVDFIDRVAEFKKARQCLQRL